MKILVIDDHPLFVEGISLVLKRLTGPVAITKTDSAQGAVDQLELDADFDLILLDLNMPGMDGLSLLKRFKVDELCIPVVIVSSEEKGQMIQQAFDWGAMGYIPKSHSANEILMAINSILEGELYVPQRVQALLDRLPVKQIAQSGISNKQYEVLELLASGYSNEQIATVLHRTEHTVKSHVSALFQILGAKNRTECVKIAEKRGLIRTAERL